MAKYSVVIVSAISIAISFPALSAEPQSAASVDKVEVNNSWRVFEGGEIENPVYVTIKNSGNHWDIENIYDYLPLLRRSQHVELFMATRDFQQWKNAYIDMANDCEDFEVKESDYQSVCTSVFGEKKIGRAVIGVLFGGTGKVLFGYNKKKVSAAIHSIRPEQAQEMLTTFEQSER